MSCFDGMRWVKVVSALSEVLFGYTFVAHQISNLLNLTFSHTIFEHIISIHSVAFIWWISGVFAHIDALVHLLILFWSYCSGLGSVKWWLASCLTGSRWFDSVAGNLAHLRLLSAILVDVRVPRFGCVFGIFAHLLLHMLHTLLCNNLPPCRSTLTSRWHFLFSPYLGYWVLYGLVLSLWFQIDGASGFGSWWDPGLVDHLCLA